MGDDVYEREKGGKKRRSFALLLEDFQQSGFRLAKWEGLLQAFTLKEVKVLFRYCTDSVW